MFAANAGNPAFLVPILQTAHLWANTGVVERVSFSRLECEVHDRLHIYPLCGIFYFLTGYVDDCVMVNTLVVHVNTAILVAPSGDQVCIALHW